MILFVGCNLPYLTWELNPLFSLRVPTAQLEERAEQIRSKSYLIQMEREKMQMELSHKRARVELERAASTNARNYEVGPASPRRPRLCAALVRHQTGAQLLWSAPGHSSVPPNAGRLEKGGLIWGSLQRGLFAVSVSQQSCGVGRPASDWPLPPLFSSDLEEILGAGVGVG